MKRKSSKPVLSPPVQVSYAPGLFEADEYGFGATLLFKKDDKEHMQFLKKAKQLVEEVAQAQWPDPDTRPLVKAVGGAKSPIKDGDTALKDDGTPYLRSNPEYAGHYFIRISSKNRQPDVRLRDKKTKATAEDLESGMYVRASINAYAYFPTAKNPKCAKGVTFGLNGVLVWEDTGERFGGRVAFAKAFEEVEDADYENDDPWNSVPRDDDIPF